MRIKVLGVGVDIAHAGLYSDNGNKIAEITIRNPPSGNIPADVYQQHPNSNRLELGIEYDLVRRDSIPALTPFTINCKFGVTES